MKLGLQVNNFAWKDGPPSIRSHVADLVRAAEQAGFYSIWVMDHYFQIPDFGPVEDPMLEAYTLLGYIAAITGRVKLGTMVSGAMYHSPGILAKTVTTLDTLSGGRAYFGIGAGWFEPEALALGIPFLSTKERLERLEETLQIVRQMWSEDNGPYEGKHYQLGQTLNSPQPISRPHPPILIGGTGEKKTLRLVAQHGDACNLWYSDMDDVKRKLDVLKQHCSDVGRDYDDIERTVIGDPPEESGKINPAEMVAECVRLAEQGIQQWIVEMNRPLTPADAEIFGRDVIPMILNL